MIATEAMQALVAGQIPASDLCREVLADRDRLLEEIHIRDQKIAELKRCIALGADMVICLTRATEAGT
jgi:flagellar biosynthesis/type III secretory pathway chaperone